MLKTSAMATVGPLQMSMSSDVWKMFMSMIDWCIPEIAKIWVAWKLKLCSCIFRYFIHIQTCDQHEKIAGNIIHPFTQWKLHRSRRFKWWKIEKLFIHWWVAINTIWKLTHFSVKRFAISLIIPWAFHLPHLLSIFCHVCGREKPLTFNLHEIKQEASMISDN